MDEKDIQDMMESLRSSLEAGGGALDDMIEGLREVGATSEDVAEMLADLRKEGVAESRQTEAYTRNLERLNQELKPAPDIMDKFNKGIELTDREIRQLAAQVKNQKKKQEEAVKGLGKSFLNIGRSALQGQSSLSGLGNSIGQAASAAGDLAGEFGVYGKAAGAALKAFGYVAAEASKQLEDLKGSYQSLSEVGATATDGMSGLVRQYQNAGLQLAQYTTVVKQNAETMAAFRGLVSDGAEDFAKVTGQLAQGTNNDLRNLGYTTDQIAESTANYISIQTKLGRSQKMSVEDLTQGSKAYALELDLLSKATGQSREQMKSAQDRALSDSRFRAKAMLMEQQGYDKQARAMTDFSAYMEQKAGPETAQGFRDLIASGGVATTEAARKVVRSVRGAEQIAKGVAEGSISVNDATNMVANGMQANAEQINRLQTLTGATNSAYISSVELANYETQHHTDAIKQANIAQQEQTANTDAMTAATMQAEKAQQAFQLQLQRLYAMILPATASTLQFFADALKTGIDWAVEFADGIAKTWNVLKAVTNWIDTKLTSTFGGLYTGIKTYMSGLSDIVLGLSEMTSLLGIMTGSFSEGTERLKKGFEEILDGMSAVFGTAGNFIIDTVDKLFGVDLRAAFDTVLDQFAAFQKMMGTILSPITKGLTDAVGKMQDFLTDILTKTWDMVVTKIGDVLGIDVKGMLSTASKAVSGFTDTIASAASDLSNVAKTAWAEGGISGGTTAGGERIAPKYGPESGPPSKGLTGNAATTQAMQFFMSKGWSKEQAAGLVGNLQQESGNFAADVVSGRRRGDSGKAVGIAQWHADRQQLFQQRYGKSLAGSSLEEQLDFVNYELTQGTERKAGAILKQARSAQEAGSLVDKYYERSAGTERSQRMANAAKLAGAAIDQPSVLLSTNLPNINPVQPTPVGARADLNQARSAQTRVAGAANTMTVLPQTTPAPAGTMGTYPNTGASEVPGAATSAGTPGGHFGPMAAAMPIDTLALTQNGQTNLTAPKNQTPSISAEPNQPQATETTATAPTPDQALKFAEQTMRYLQELNSKTDNMIQLLKDGNKNTKDIKSNQAA